MFLETIFMLFLTILLIWYYLLKKNLKHLEHLPGPKPNILFGNVVDFDTPEKYLNALMRYTKTYGGIIRAQAGPYKQVLLVTDYNFMEFILSSMKTIEKTEEYSFFEDWLGTGLLTSGGMKWRKRRKLLTPAFHFSILEQFINTFESVNDVLIRKLNREVGKGSFDIYPYITLSTLDIICEAAMGTSVNAQENDQSEYVKSVKEMCTLLVKRIFSVVKRSDFFYKFFWNYYREKKALHVLHSYTDAVIDRKIREMENETEEIDEFGRKKKLAFLDLLLRCTIDGKHLSRQDLREEVDTFMFEGHDTTGSAIAFTLYCLANNPSVQEKAYQEQLDILPEGSKITYNSLQQMKYLEMVIKETLRLYPSVPFIGRELKEDLEYNGHIWPKGLGVMIFPFGAHRNPTFFPDPEKFIPERFESNTGEHPYAYIPFSAGPRNCIGQKFAMLEMKSTVSKILRNFKLKPGKEELTLAAEVILISKSGIHLSLDKR